MPDCDATVDLISRMGGLGRILIKFLQYLASWDFASTRIHNFMHPKLGCYSMLIRGEWLPLHRVSGLFQFSTCIKGYGRIRR